jgi:uncharacterized protein (DUF2345 family)
VKATDEIEVEAMDEVEVEATDEVKVEATEEAIDEVEMGIDEVVIDEDGATKSKSTRANKPSLSVPMIS